jgi:hypothetical protein
VSAASWARMSARCGQVAASSKITRLTSTVRQETRRSRMERI